MKERHIITGGRALSEVQEHFRQAVEGLSYRTLQDQALNAEAAAIEGVRRVTAGDTTANGKSQSLPAAPPTCR